MLASTTLHSNTKMASSFLLMAIFFTFVVATETQLLNPNEPDSTTTISNGTTTDSTEASTSRKSQIDDDCPDGYMGKDCKRHYCDEYCQNGGTCTSAKKCSCPMTYPYTLDKHCKKSICDVDCGPTGTCVLKDNDWKCVCAKGYSGVGCKTETQVFPVDAGICKYHIDSTLNTSNSVNPFTFSLATKKEQNYCLLFVRQLKSQCSSHIPDKTLTIETCKKYCLPTQTIVCDLIFDTSSNCPSEKTSYGYDKDTGKCKSFRFRGCFGNRNRLDTMEKCQEKHLSLNSLMRKTANVTMPQQRTCYVRGKMHFVTFDGLHFNLLAACKYILLQDPNNSGGSNDIILINDPNMDNSRAAKKQVMIKTDGNTVLLGRRLDNGKFIVKLNNKLIELPYNGNPKIKVVGRHVMVVTSDEIVVTFDGHEDVSITVDPHAETNTKFAGLCGSLDGNANNDLRDYYGGAVRSIKAFGSVYQENKETCKETLTSTSLLFNPYENTDLVFNNAESRCDVIMTNAFKPCHGVVKPDKYKLLCMQDLAYCNYDKNPRCVCSSLSLYASVCQSKGVTLNWRTSNMCPVTCTGGKMFYSCGSACPKSCDNMLSATAKCHQNCVDGCHCPPDLYWDKRNSRCVPINQCSCYRDGVAYAHGSVRSSKCESCICSQ